MCWRLPALPPSLAQLKPEKSAVFVSTTTNMPAIWLKLFQATRHKSEYVQNFIKKYCTVPQESVCVSFLPEKIYMSDFFPLPSYPRRWRKKFVFHILFFNSGALSEMQRRVLKSEGLSSSGAFWRKIITFHKSVSSMRSHFCTALPNIDFSFSSKKRLLEQPNVRRINFHYVESWWVFSTTNLISPIFQ